MRNVEAHVGEGPTSDLFFEYLRRLTSHLNLEEDGEGLVALCVLGVVEAELVKVSRDVADGLQAHPVRRSLARGGAAFGERCC